MLLLVHVWLYTPLQLDKASVMHKMEQQINIRSIDVVEGVLHHWIDIV